jgi:hypothetical protein
VNKNIYSHTEWVKFSKKVVARDNNKCVKCNRTSPEVVLQAHHEVYTTNKPPWESALSDCITLCKGCHAREHGLIEPNSGWFLVSIDDLGAVSGICERLNCGSKIRYEHLTYHPKWGYKIVGSTCIEHLTQEDQNISSELLAIYHSISSFLHKVTWTIGQTNASRSYIKAKYGHDYIRIYGDELRYKFQLAIKVKGKRYHEYTKLFPIHNKTLIEAKELSYIALKGIRAKNDADKITLRALYKKLIP